MGKKAKGRGGDGALEYWLERAQRFLAQGRTDDALGVLDRFWPGAPPERLRWLLAHWPARAALELTPESVAALNDAVLWLADGDFEALAVHAALPAGWADQARLLRRASAAIAAGDDDAARAHLRSLGRSSPFADAQRFLRGLSAWYARDDAEAAALFAPLGPVYAGAAAKLTSAAADDEGVTREVVAALRDRRPNRALDAAGAAFGRAAPALRRLLARDLPGALLALGVPPGAIVERMRRAAPGFFDYVPEEALRARLAEAAGDPDEAASRWMTFAQAQALGPDTPRTAAAVANRCGALLLREADAAESELHASWFVDPDDEAEIDVMREQALLLLETATLAEPEERGWWPALLDATRFADRTRRAQIFERYVERFPEAPDALLRAAEACAERGSFDKGLRYARRAAGLQPLDRGVRELEARLLEGKARKKFQAGQHAVGRALLAEARDVPRRGPDSVLETWARSAALEGLRGRTDDADGLRRAALDADPRPWLWAAYEAIARAELGPKRRKRAPATTPLRFLGSDVPATSQAELRDLVRLSESLEAEDRDLAQVPYTCALYALRRALPPLDDPELVRKLARRLAPDEMALTLAIRGQQIAPEDEDFVRLRYSLALHLQRPPAELVNAEAELRQVLERHVARHATDAWCPVEEGLQALIEEVHDRLRAPRKGAARRKRGGGPAQPRLPFDDE